MSNDSMKKLEHMKKILRDTNGCAVAFSGGVDSSLVLTVAHEVLGNRCLAVIATSSTYSQGEFKQAVDWVNRRSIPYSVMESEELDIAEFTQNPLNRCYLCKKELFDKVQKQAATHGFEWVADGSNADDTGDYRPGLNAARELGVLSPLMEAGLTKKDIRRVARDVYNLPMAEKPAMACLASRFPYGASITRDKLDQVEKIEDFLNNLGFAIYRARHHGDIVRLELGPDEFETVFHADMRKQITDYAKGLGFKYITLDLDGYRTGSMNEVLDNQKRI